MRAIYWGLLIGLLPAACARAPASANVALGKQVLCLLDDGVDRQPWLLTDGNWASHPLRGKGISPCQNDYVIDLQRSDERRKSAADSSRRYRLQSIVIHWDLYGAPFLGRKDEIGRWLPGKKPDDFVNFYRILYRSSKAPDDAWQLVHEFRGPPIQENAPNAFATKKPHPSGKPYFPWSVTTHILELDLRHVTQLRLIAVGEYQHSIHEFEAHGIPE